MKSADDEEVTDETGFLDDREFELQPVHDDLDGGGDFGIVHRQLCAVSDFSDFD